MKAIVLLAIIASISTLFVKTTNAGCDQNSGKKPGPCPNIYCFISDCVKDCDCYGNQKCCNGCCATPTGSGSGSLPKPGKCPDILNCFISDCTTDSDCSGSKKCCNGCCFYPQ